MSDYMAAMADSQIEGAISENEALRLEIERLRGIVPEVLERLNDALCAENERLRAAVNALLKCPSGEYCDAYPAAYKLAQEALRA